MSVGVANCILLYYDQDNSPLRNDLPLYWSLTGARLGRKESPSRRYFDGDAAGPLPCNKARSGQNHWKKNSGADEGASKDANAGMTGLDNVEDDWGKWDVRFFMAPPMLAIKWQKREL